MLQISDDFTMEDIRAIRDDFSVRYENNWDIDAMLKEIHEGAARFGSELESQRVLLRAKPA
jgi:hypothetical protein